MMHTWMSTHNDILRFAVFVLLCNPGKHDETGHYKQSDSESLGMQQGLFVLMGCGPEQSRGRMQVQPYSIQYPDSSDRF